MATEYEVRIYNAAGALQYILVPRNGLIELAYTRKVNEVGLASVTVELANPVVTNLAKDWQIQILRSDAVSGIAWYTDFYGFFRASVLQTDENNVTRFTAHFACINHLLARSIVGYKAGVSNRSSFAGVVAETIAKTLVTRNATTSGTTADGRVRNVPTWGGYVSVQSDGATGASLSYTCPYRNLLTALQEVATLGGGDFQMVRTAARAWQFRWYNTLLGTNRTGSVLFSPGMNNVANPLLRRGRIDEATVAIAAGSDTGTARAISIYTGATYDASVNSLEMYIDARDQSGNTLADRAELRLEEQRSFDEFSFDVLQTSSTQYGLHYFLGDWVSAAYGGVSATKKIDAVTVTYQARGDNPEHIQIGLRDT